MSERKIKIGEEEKNYNLHDNTGIEQFVIKVHNKNSRQRSYYFFNMEETEWSLTEEDGVCIITVYGTRDNGEVLSKELYKKSTSGEIKKLSCRPSQPMSYLDTFDYKVEEHVPKPNVSNPVFKLKGSQRSETNYYIRILKNENTKFIKLLSSENSKIYHSTINLGSRRNYKCKLYEVDEIEDNQQYIVTAGVEYQHFKTRNCLDDVKKLMEKAESFIQIESKQGYYKGLFPVKYLYRNKPSYHQTIDEFKKTGIMAKYLKDNNGDPFSSINQNIKGLHFCATPVNEFGALPEKSLFGDYRIMIKPEYLAEGCNLYFADFYCMLRHRPHLVLPVTRRHWVLLVLTKVGSKEDKFCKNRLVKLDIKNNPFFCNQGYGFMVQCPNANLQVEILYTEDINKAEISKVDEDIEICGQGSSTPGGLPKTPSCPTCNLPK